MRRLLLCSLIALLSCIVSFQVKAQTADNAYYGLGVFAYEEGNFQSAEAHFKKALKADPEDPSANYYMGKTLMAQDRFNEAEKYLMAAWKKDPELSGLAYDRAFLHYKMSQFGQGADLFSALVEADPDHVMANFYGGICLYKKGRYAAADTYLMSAAKKSPELKVKSYYYSGLCQYYLGQEQEAIQRLTFVQSNSDSKELRDNAGNWLNKIKKGEKPAKPYALEAKLAFVYDGNVPLDSTERDDYSPSKEADSAVIASVSGRYNVVNKSDWVLGIGAGRIQSWYTDLNEFNMSKTSGLLYGYLDADPFLYGLNLRPMLYQVDGEDFLLVYEAEPYAAYMINRDLLTRLTYTYSVNDYRQDDYDDRDGSTHEGFWDIVYHLKADKGYVSGGAGYEYNTASEEEFGYGRIKARLALSLELAWKLRFKAVGNISNKTYAEENSVENEKRQDDRYEGFVSLSRTVHYDWLRMALEYIYTQNNSNFDDYAYTRQAAGIVFTASF